MNCCGGAAGAVKRQPSVDSEEPARPRSEKSFFYFVTGKSFKEPEPEEGEEDVVRRLSMEKPSAPKTSKSFFYFVYGGKEKSFREPQGPRAPLPAPEPEKFTPAPAAPPPPKEDNFGRPMGTSLDGNSPWHHAAHPEFCERIK